MPPDARVGREAVVAVGLGGASACRVKAAAASDAKDQISDRVSPSGASRNRTGDLLLARCRRGQAAASRIRGGGGWLRTPRNRSPRGSVPCSCCFCSWVSCVSWIDRDTHAHLIAPLQRFAAELGYSVARRSLEELHRRLVRCSQAPDRRQRPAARKRPGPRARARARPRARSRLPRARAAPGGGDRRHGHFQPLSSENGRARRGRAWVTGVPHTRQARTGP